MAEEYELTDPIVIPEVMTNKYKVIALNLNMEIIFNPAVPEPGLVLVTLKDNNNVMSSYQYEGQEAVDMMKWMNTANFSVNSMQKRVLQKLTNDGKLPPGTITGTPDTPPVE